MHCSMVVSQSGWPGRQGSCRAPSREVATRVGHLKLMTTAHLQQTVSCPPGHYQVPAGERVRRQPTCPEIPAALTVLHCNAWVRPEYFAHTCASSALLSSSLLIDSSDVTQRGYVLRTALQLLSCSETQIQAWQLCPVDCSALLPTQRPSWAYTLPLTPSR